MVIYRDINLSQFQFWGDARPVAAHLTQEELFLIQEELESQYPNGISAGELNDMFAYSTDYIVSIIGYDSEDDFINERY